MEGEKRREEGTIYLYIVKCDITEERKIDLVFNSSARVGGWVAGWGGDKARHFEGEELSEIYETLFPNLIRL